MAVAAMKQAGSEDGGLDAKIGVVNLPNQRYVVFHAIDISLIY